MPPKKGSHITFTIDDAAFKGKGIGRVDGKAIFVKNTAPGDHIEAQITKRKKSFLEGRLTNVISGGPSRITPRCSHATACGGCSWQHVDYQEQLRFKRQQVQDHMQRIGKLEQLPVHATLGCEDPFYYRNKMEYTFSNRRWLSREEIEADQFISNEQFSAGLHAPGQFDKVLNLTECHLQDPVSFKLLHFTRNWCLEHTIPPLNRREYTGVMRNLVVRQGIRTNQLMVNIVTYEKAEEPIDALAAAMLGEFPAITTLVHNINGQNNPTAVGQYQRVLHGSGTIVEKLGEYRFTIHPNAFFQTNTLQAEKLYEIAQDYADINPTDTVYDLYCGVGTLTLFLSSLADKIIGVELEQVAVENARRNARENTVENVHFVQGDMRQEFTPQLINAHGAPDCIITDPPRAGMDDAVVEHLNQLKVPKLVYISCNTATMARDLKKLSAVYDVQELQPVDMFPQTYHIEAVANLRCR